ncbi:MAG: polysaccharide deacetylase family protein [Myxococcota bacterium]
MKIILIVVSFLLLFIFTIFLSIRVSPILLLSSGLILFIALYIVFIFYPKFDPTGFTIIRLKKGKKEIAFTFDDGPDPVITPIILDILKGHSVRATFFCLGFKAEKYPEIIERIRREGHNIGNHGYSHTKLHNKDIEFIKREIDRTEEILKPLSQINGKKLFRSPHGFKNFSLIRLLRERNYILAGWTRGIWDSDGSPPDILLKRAINYLDDGVIFLFHDGRDIEGDGKNTTEFLKMFIPVVRERGYNISDNLFG